MMNRSIAMWRVVSCLSLVGVTAVGCANEAAEEPQQDESSALGRPKGWPPVLCDPSIDAKYAAHSYLGAPVHFTDQLLPDGGRFRDYQVGSIYVSPRSPCPYVVRFGFWERFKSEMREKGPLKYPTSDEASPGAGQAYQYFEEGSLFWNEGPTGVRELRGDVARKHRALGGASYGFPLTEQRFSGAGEVADFDNARRIVASRVTGAHEVRGLLLDTYDRIGAERSYLGLPLSDELCKADGTCTSWFQWGNLFWDTQRVREMPVFSDQSGAEVGISGGDPRVPPSGFAPLGSCDRSITDHYARNAWLGAPVQPADVTLPASNGLPGAFRDYANGSIYLDATTGCAFAVTKGAIGARWMIDGHERSPLGYPTSDELVDEPGKTHQYFRFGSLWSIASRDAFGRDTTTTIALTGPIAVEHARYRLSLGYPIQAQVRGTAYSFTITETGSYVVQQLTENDTVFKPYELHTPFPYEWAKPSVQGFLRSYRGTDRAWSCGGTLCTIQLTKGVATWTLEGGLRFTPT
jgi:hypothetical protein